MLQVATAASTFGIPFMWDILTGQVALLAPRSILCQGRLGETNHPDGAAAEGGPPQPIVYHGGPETFKIP